MLEQYKNDSGEYIFPPKGKESAKKYAERQIKDCWPDIRQNCLNGIVEELCDAYYDEWRAYDRKLRPVHKKVGNDWIRVDPDTAAKRANDIHFSNYNNILALLCSIVYDAGRIYGIRCTDAFIEAKKEQGFGRVIPFFEETLKLDGMGISFAPTVG